MSSLLDSQMRASAESFSAVYLSSKRGSSSGSMEFFVNEDIAFFLTEIVYQNPDSFTYNFIEVYPESRSSNRIHIREQSEMVLTK